MISVPSVMTIAKYGFLSLVVTGAGFLIANTTVVTVHRAGVSERLIQRRPLQPQPGPSELSQGARGCLLRPGKPFCALAPDRRARLLAGGARQITDDDETTEHPVWVALRHFFRIAHALHVRPVLLEPSVLFCALSPNSKTALLSAGFHPSPLQGSSDVVTVGLSEKEGAILGKANSSWILEESGFTVSGSHLFSPVRVGDQDNTSHYFFSRTNASVHVVVMYEFKSNLWYDGLSAEVLGAVNLLFNGPGVLPNLTSMELPVSDDTLVPIPSDPASFLFRLHKSGLRVCSRTAEPSRRHPSLSEEEVRNRAAIALQELESKLRPHLVGFWIWGESLTGWKDSCDIFALTSVLHVAVSRRTHQSVNLTNVLDENEYLFLTDRILVNEEDVMLKYDCHGLEIKISIAFEDDKSIVVYQANEDSSHFRNVYKTFSLCSADILDLVVLLPCQSPEPAHEDYLKGYF